MNVVLIIIEERKNRSFRFWNFWVHVLSAVKQLFSPKLSSVRINRKDWERVKVIDHFRVTSCPCFKTSPLSCENEFDLHPAGPFLYGKAQAQSYLLSILWSRLNRSLSSSVRFRPGGFSSANLTRSFLPEEVFYKCNWFFKVIFFTTFVPVYLQYSAVIKECLWVIITFIN